MWDWIKRLGLTLCVALALGACASDGDGPSGDEEEVEEKDPEEARIEAARAAWPEYTGDSHDTIDLSAYDTVTLVAFENLTSNSREDDAGYEVVDEIADVLASRYSGLFEEIRISDEPLGEPGEVVLRGQVYDFSSGAGWNPWTGRNEAEFKAEFKLENGQSGELLKSAQIKEDGYQPNDYLLREAADEIAKLLARSKGDRD